MAGGCQDDSCGGNSSAESAWLDMPRVEEEKPPLRKEDSSELDPDVPGLLGDDEDGYDEEMDDN